MDVYDNHSFLENTMHYMHKQDLEFPMHNIYRLFLNIIIQHIHLRFNNGLSLNFIKFEYDINDMFDEINAYIPQFTNKNCYVNIIQHAAANVITSSCDFMYYHKITVHATLVTTRISFICLIYRMK